MLPDILDQEKPFTVHVVWQEDQIQKLWSTILLYKGEIELTKSASEVWKDLTLEKIPQNCQIFLKSGGEDLLRKEKKKMHFSFNDLH